MDTALGPLDDTETVQELAARVHVSKPIIYQWLGMGLPSFKIGRTRRLSRAASDSWLRAQLQQPDPTLTKPLSQE